MAHQQEKNSFNTEHRLLSQIREGRVSHAYILTGANGSQKRALALRFAAGLCCREENPPCGNCSQCKKVFEGAHQDIHLTEDGADGKSIGVDRVREIGKSAYTVPGEGEWSVYIIDCAEKMTVQAQNALLKVLEEPPKSVVFLLLTNSLLSLLPTVRSRAVICNIQPPDVQNTIDRLKSDMPAKKEKELFAAVAFSDDLKDEKAVDDALQQMKWAVSFFENLLQGSKADYMKNYTKLSKNRGMLVPTVEAVEKLCRDIALAKDDIREGWYFSGYEDQICRMAAALTKKKILTLYDITAKTLRLFAGTYSNAALAAIVFLNRFWEETH